MAKRSTEENRREFFRIALSAVPSTMTIIEVGERPITPSPRPVTILDASGGGLSLITDEDLPIRKGVVAQFTFGIGPHRFTFRGLFVRKVDDRTTFEYGVKFIDVDEHRRGLLLSVLGRLQVEQRKAGK